MISFDLLYLVALELPLASLPLFLKLFPSINSDSFWADKCQHDFPQFLSCTDHRSQYCFLTELSPSLIQGQEQLLAFERAIKSPTVEVFDYQMINEWKRVSINLFWVYPRFPYPIHGDASMHLAYFILPGEEIYIYHFGTGSKFYPERDPCPINFRPEVHEPLDFLPECEKLLQAGYLPLAPFDPLVAQKLIEKYPEFLLE